MNPFSFRPQVEQLDGRCLPSANPATTVGGAALVPAAAASANIPEQHAIPIRLSTHISSDGSVGLIYSGVGGQLGQMTGDGSLDSFVTDMNTGEGTISGTATLIAANGDELFATFSGSWDLKSGVGGVAVSFTGGTGRFAGATGFASEVCHVSGDPTSPTFQCDSDGTGTLVLDHSR
jgi:hypothetical protein